MSLPESRGETNSQGERSETERERRRRNVTDQQNTDTPSATTDWQLLLRVRKKSRTKGGKTGAAQEMKEREIWERVWGRGPSHCFRLESWPKWSCETERERQSQRHYWDTCQAPWDVRCEREKQSEGGWEKGGGRGGVEGLSEEEREAERMKTNSKHFDEREDSQVILLQCVHFCITLRLKLSISHLKRCV